MYSRISVYWQKQEIHICKIHMQKKIVCLILFFSWKKNHRNIFMNLILGVETQWFQVISDGEF